MADILFSSVYLFSTKLTVSTEEAATRILYDYYRHPDKLSDLLMKCLQHNFKSGALSLVEEYNGFGSDGIFDPVNAVDELIRIFLNDQKFRDEAFKYARLYRALKNLSMNGNTGHGLRRGHELVSSSPAGEPLPMINKDLIFDFRDNEKTEFDMAQLAANIAVRSILGKKSYCKTNKQHILARMFGYVTHRQLHEAQLSPAIKRLTGKYSSRYWMDKVLTALECDWGVLVDGKGMRGLYVGVESKIGLGAFILATETKKQYRKIEVLLRRKEQARAEALQQLNKGQHLKKDSSIIQTTFNHGTIEHRSKSDEGQISAQLQENEPGSEAQSCRIPT